MSDTDDDTPTLSAHAMAALQDFYREQKEEQARFEHAVKTGDTSNVSINEDWQLSQFWYSDETATVLAKEALSIAGEHGRIACVSAPTVYKKIRQIKPKTCTVKCLEYDERFKVFGEDFLFYDYNEPTNLPADWRQLFDVVILDPPFINEDCACKMSVTAKFLAKDKVIFCTGIVMEEPLFRLLNVKPCSYIPSFEKNRLQNEFRCFTNYESAILNSL